MNLLASPPGALWATISRIFQQHGFWAAVIVGLILLGLWAAFKWHDENKNRM